MFIWSNSMKFRKTLFALGMVVVLVFSLSACMQMGLDQNETPVPATTEANYDKKLEEIVAILDRYYIDGYDTSALGDYLAEAAIAATGDRWSYYMTAEEYADSVETNNNAYVGIGVTVRLANEGDNGYTITAVNEGGAADDAGLLVGDIIVAVEGENAIEIGMDETKNRIRGEEGTQVTLTIQRGDGTFDVTLTRKTVPIQVVTTQLLENTVGYIKLSQFTHDTASMVIEAIENLRKDGATSLVFDLRFNPGGYKNELVELLDYLLPEGPLFRSVSYSGKEEVEYSDASCLDLPMAVLVNGDSYSAAEFFAAALQEYDRATVVGTQTCGKANYQQTFVLSDGSAIAVSTGHYQTPNGVTLEGIGVTPDVVVEIDEETYYSLYYDMVDYADDEQLQAAISAVLSAS